MAKKSEKYLVETSVVPAIVGASTEAHGQYCKDAIKDGEPFTSTYIRKEFIHVFVCELANAAFEIGMRSSVRDSLLLLAERYSIRAIKVDMKMVAHLLDQGRAMNNPNVAAEEIGRLAINWLKTFDKIFRHKIPNNSGCRIGNKGLSINYNTMLKDLNDFYRDFIEPVDDCPVNEFVGLGDPSGRGQAFISEAKTKKIDSVKNLAKIFAKGERFVCDECKKIGDLVIALEQPEDLCLVHLDNSYKKLCEFLNRINRPLKSAYAIDKEVMPSSAKPKGS